MLEFLLLVALADRSVAAESLPAFSVTNEELLDISKKLRDADDNKAQPSQIRLNYQEHTNTHDMTDNAKLFSEVDSSLFDRPSYKQFLALTDNFYRETGREEPRVSVQEDQLETNAFLSTIMDSRPWELLYEFLQKKARLCWGCPLDTAIRDAICNDTDLRSLSEDPAAAVRNMFLIVALFV
ncbi:unnamed protein product [Heligmosomoides polygyrus]|uniref:Endoribonuclease n=1 Tax=Heligmosomoides polygyrus TaxID=6339 RepID=A0A183FVF8_HELPZ|nr:unnamed protein product [Heligmosomoides polygyrus]